MHGILLLLFSVHSQTRSLIIHFPITGCQKVGMLGLVSRLSTCWPTTCPNGGVVSTPLPIKLLSAASPGFKPIGRACRGISLRTKGRFYQVVVRSILVYGCETWHVRVADGRMLEVLDNDSNRRILRVRRRDCVPSVELRRRLCLTSIPPLVVQRRLRWFGYAVGRPEGELIKDLLLPTPPRT